MLEDSWIIKETDDEVIGATIMAGCNMTDFLNDLELREDIDFKEGDDQLRYIWNYEEYERMKEKE